MEITVEDHTYMPNPDIDASFSVIHSALADIVGIMNSPQRDASMIREAGISLDRALFPLLLIVARKSPISVTDLADLVGRDHSTVSRQILKLEELGQVERCAPGARKIDPAHELLKLVTNHRHE